MYFDPEFFTESNRNVVELFHLDLSRMPEIYFEKKETYIAEVASGMRKTLNRLWQLYESPSAFT